MVKRRVGGLVKAYVFYYLYCFYRIVALDWVDGLIMFYDIDKLIEQVIGKKFLFYPNDKRRLTMKMKDFKAALRSKLNYIEKNLKVEDDYYYLGYISCMEDILEFIDGGEESQEIDNI